MSSFRRKKKREKERDLEVDSSSPGIERCLIKKGLFFDDYLFFFFFLAYDAADGTGTI